MKILVLDEKGHSEFDVGNPQQALSQIQQYPNKWVFIDGEYRNDTSTLNLADIEQASEIVITEKLVGG
jgi:16S rRNA C1402 (ribose-2'-O) methylase RsmI